jgi:hypothetical protein
MSEFVRATRHAFAGLIGERPVRTATRLYDRLNRLSYDSDPNGRRSAAALRSMKDIGRGKRAFIIGNGPSLGTMDLAPLRDEVTFGLNRVYLLFEKMGFPTTFMVTVNQLVIEQAIDEILAAARPTFMSWHSRQFVTDRSLPIFLPTGRAREFTRDPTRAIWEGATVTYVALQLAFYMGYEPVVLIGVDHSFTTQGPAHKEVTSGGDDPNHFDPRYFGKGFRWQLPDLVTSEIAYAMAREAYGAAGRRVLDATVGGKLTIFPKVDYRELVGLAREASVLHAGAERG